MVKIGNKINKRQGNSTNVKKTANRVQTRRSARSAGLRTGEVGISRVVSTTRKSKAGGKSKNKAYKSILETQNDENRSLVGMEIETTSISGANNHYTHSPAMKRQLLSGSRHESTIVTSTPTRLYKKCKKAIKPTNRKSEHKAQPIFSLDQILSKSNIKDSTLQSEISTKYSKSDYSRISRSDLFQNYKKTHIDAINKIEHNLFENLKQGHIMLKPSKKKEVPKAVIVEHGNKVFSFIKEVSQGNGNDVEFEDIVREVDLAGPTEKTGLINQFRDSLEKLQKDVITSVGIIDELLYTRRQLTVNVDSLMRNIKRKVASFCPDYLNLIVNVHEDLYEISYNYDKIEIKANCVGNFDEQELAKYRSIRADIFKSKLKVLLEKLANEMISKFKTTSNKQFLQEKLLYIRLIKYVKPSKPAVEQESKPQTPNPSPQQSAVTLTATTPQLTNDEKSSVNSKKVVLDTKSQITDYVS